MPGTFVDVRDQPPSPTGTPLNSATATAINNPYFLLSTMRGATHAADVLRDGASSTNRTTALCGKSASAVMKKRDGEPGGFKYPVPAESQDLSCDECKAAMEAGKRPERKMDYRADIQGAVNRMAGTKIGIKRELEGLEARLHDGERVLAVANGRYNGHLALVALTDARIFCTQESVMGRGKNEVFALDRISGIEYESGLMLGEIVLSGSGISVKIDQIEKHDAEHLVRTARDRMSRPAAAPAPAPASAPAPADDAAVRLARLVALSDAGLLTPEEYAQQRAAIVAML